MSLISWLIGLVIAIGIVGTVLPFLPGITLIWLATLVYGVVEGFGAGGWWCFGIITALAIAGFASNVVLPGRRADRAGATKLSLLLGIVLGIVGFFAIPVIGFAIGGAGGIWIGEVIQGKSTSDAWESTKATLVGVGLSIIAQLAIGVAMAFTWGVWVVFA